MPIIFLKMDFVGEGAANPRLGRMITTDNFADIVETNYIVSYAHSQNISLESTDMIAISYGDGRGWFNVDFDNENINLNPSQTQGSPSVVLPTVPDNVPFWDDDNGRLDNTGYAVSDKTLPLLVSTEGESTIHNISVFFDNNGSIEDIGISFSNPSNPHAVTVSGAIIVGHVPSFVDTNGSIIDSGQRMPFVTSVSGAGGSATQTVTVMGVTTGNPCWFSGGTITNNVAIVQCNAIDVNQVELVFTGDPGAFTGKVWVQKAP